MTSDARHVDLTPLLDVVLILLIVLLNPDKAAERIEYLSGEIDTLSSQVSLKSETIAARNEALEALARERDELSNRLQAAQQANQTAQNLLDEKDVAIASLQANLDQAGKQVEAAQQQSRDSADQQAKMGKFLSELLKNQLDAPEIEKLLTPADRKRLASMVEPERMLQELVKIFAVSTKVAIIELYLRDDVLQIGRDQEDKRSLVIQKEGMGAEEVKRRIKAEIDRYEPIIREKTPQADIYLVLPFHDARALDSHVSLLEQALDNWAEAREGKRRIIGQTKMEVSHE
jgi:prophage DNA circulation protein